MPNRLAASSSPYLLQHQHNPVDWYPWGDEAFAAARERNVPIFLSVGYSTCYWCHVMERESFESEAIARMMNERYVCIKVDREERPDVDDVYMAAVQAFTPGGRGGWPMSVFLEPATLKPFWAGTYFPPEPRPGMGDMPAFPQILTALSEAWKTQHTEVLQQAEDLADAVRERTAHPAEPAPLGEREVTLAVAQLIKMHDPVHGGFGPAPKFPQSAFLDLLLSTRAAAGDDDTRQAIDHVLRNTLTHMAQGGLFDQVGGGFHRYAVDAHWTVPHFEKMLYDNGALAAVYAEAAALYGDPLFARVAHRTCAYIMREMTAPDGAFFSAQDAEVNHREGQNYLWTSPQLVEVLGEADAAWAAQIYGVSKGFNFRDPHHPADPPSNVLTIVPTALPPNAWADQDFVRRLDSVNARLYEARLFRDQPSTDTKVIAAWNGLVIAGLARAGALLNEPKFLHAAGRAAEFVLFRMRDGAGNLLRTFSRARAAIPAFFEDYALFIHGLLTLHTAAPTADGAATYLEAARDLTARAQTLFGDGHGAYFDTLADQLDLFVRTRTTYDGALPSGTSVMINNLVSLAAITRDRAYAQSASQAIAVISGQIGQSPLAAANSVRALLRLMALDRATLNDALPAADAHPHAPPAAHDDPDFTPVEILSAVESLAIPTDQPTGLILKITIAPGYHINAAMPGDDTLIPFKVHLISGTGVAVYADYPPGTPYGVNHEIRVYAGSFELPIVLERTGPWTGTPLLAVTYQACTDQACLAPRTVELDVELENGT